MERPTIRLLMLEDDNDQARLVTDMLKHVGGGYEIVRAATLCEAMAWLGKTVFDLLLTDLGLPDSNGLATFVRIRVAAPDVPIIVLTANDDDELARAALRRGSQDYLVKGHIDGNILDAAIRYAIERHRVMGRSIRVTETLLNAERDRVVQETAGGVAQEINQPLTVVTVVADHLLSAVDPSHPDYDLIVSLRDAAVRIDKAVKNLKGAKKYVTRPYMDYCDILDLEAAANAPIDSQQP